MENMKVNMSFLFLLLISVACKPKTDLYLERGLDILSNTKEVNFNIFKGITINEIGVIRDQKEGIKTLVFKLDEDTSKEAFNNDNIFGIRVWIIDDNKNKRIENWDFNPKLTQVKKYKYITKEIKIKEDQIKKMKIYMFNEIDGEKHKIGDSLMLNKVNTYND
ncbi:hypothetical protein [Xanthomarina sp. GH4-25]|uniref:hypothetical protein n=1 Tax=Xanthomarina sp. GH4-25 TaxID=3349335 RepID=UPI00387794EB